MLGKLNKIYISIFLIIVIGIPLCSLLNIQVTPNQYIKKNEKRDKKKLPKLSFKKQTLDKFFDDLEPYLNDRLAFRSSFLELNSALQYGIGLRRYNRNVIFGNAGWLFHRESFNCSKVSNYLGVSDSTKLEFWERYFRAINNLLTEKGVAFRIILIPDKQSVYPEFLPPYYQFKYTTLLDKLSRKADIPLIDVKSVFLEAKQQCDTALFFKTDTHWNHWGAYIFYEKLMDSLQMHDSYNQQTFSIDDFYISSEKYRFDLQYLAGGTGYFDDVQLKLKKSACYPGEFLVQYKKDKHSTVHNYGDSVNVFARLTVTNEAGNGRLLYIGDSFGDAFSVFLNMTFHSIMYRNYRVFKRGANEETLEGLVDNFKPDIVIYEMAERYLAKPMTSLIRISDQINHKFAHSVPLKQISAQIPGDASLKLNYISDTNLMVQAFSADPKLLLPDYPYEGNASLSIDITCESSCVLQLFYLNMGAEDYSESKSQKVKLKKGRQTIQLGFPKTGKMRKLRLDPGNLRGTYTIHGIQVISN